MYVIYINVCNLCIYIHIHTYTPHITYMCIHIYLLTYKNEKPKSN